MGKLRDLSNQLDNITVEQQEKEILKIIKEDERLITNMNTDQLFQGIRSDGSEMPHYSRISVDTYGKPEGPIRLYDQGDFYSGFILHTEKFPILFDSTDRKTALLVDGNQFHRGYGENIFGLTKENLQDYSQNTLKEKVQKYYKDLLKLR